MSDPIGQGPKQITPSFAGADCEPALAKGVGCDLLHIPRINAMSETRRQRFAQKILTPQELAEYHALKDAARQVNRLAKQFCGKEAVVKALGTGFAQGVGFAQVEILRDEHGAPNVGLSGGALARMHALGASTCLLSLSDDISDSDNGWVQAFAVLA